MNYEKDKHFIISLFIRIKFSGNIKESGIIIKVKDKENTR